MAQKLRQQLKEIGFRLETLPITKDTLVKLLKQASLCLAELDQSLSKSAVDSMHPFTSVIVRPELLKSQDRDVKLLVAMCTCEIIRITAPEAPYDDDVLKDIFYLIVSIFKGLSDTKCASFARRVVILENLAKYRSCVMMLDLECDDLVNEMFNTFFSVARENHPQNVLTSMGRVMGLLLDESDDIPEDTLLTLLSNLGRNKSDVSMSARKLARDVIKQCSVKLEPGIKNFLVSVMSRESGALVSDIDYHEVIYDIYCCSPLVLSGIVPCLIEELLANQLDIRLKATRLVGDLFALTGFDDLEVFQPVFSMFLKRLTDKAVEVRMAVLEKAKLYLLSSPFRSQASLIISSICDRILDYDENVRKQVVAVVFDVACHSVKSIAIETMKLIAERLRDKSLLVKRYTLDRLAEMHRIYCFDETKSADFDWVPGIILKCLYDKDFGSDTIESVLYDSLFPTKFSIKDIVGRWVKVFSGFQKVEVKALERILEQKHRLQQEMQKYISLRQLNQDNDFPKKAHFSFRIMSLSFTDPANALEKFRILHQLKDANIWKHLAELLDPDFSFFQASRCRDELLEIFGEKHILHAFVSTLSRKCSYILFNKEFVRELMLETSIRRHTGNKVLALPCMNLLVVIARFDPMLFRGAEDDLLQLLKDDNEIIRDGILQVLARAGGSIRDQLGTSLSSIELLFERICVEGSRRQAKYAVHALAAITKDEGLRSLSVLYKRLVDVLEKKTHLPSVLQSLGCIAQTAMPVFETREAEIEEFIIIKILGCSNKTFGVEKGVWDDRSELCSWKIFGVKTLMKSYLPTKDAHLRVGVEKFLKILKDILSFGEISKDVESSCVDKAHLRLASAKAIIRLAKHWDHKIPVDIFHLTLWGVNNFPQAKKDFLRKVHQYIKERVLDAKYACAFLFDDIWFEKLEFEENHHNLRDVIQMCQQMKSRQIAISCETGSEIAYPECILPYIVHALAHHSLCPNVDESEDVEAFGLMYRRLHLFLSVLMHVDADGDSEATNKAKQTASAAISILKAIKCSEDAIDTSKSKNSHVICDIGLPIIKSLSPELGDLCSLPPSMCLPPALYRNLKDDDAKDTVAFQQNTCLADKAVVKHFEILTSETEPSVKDKNSDSVANEVPLSALLEDLKFKGTKSNKLMKISQSGGRNVEGVIASFENSGSGMLRNLEFNGSENLTVIPKKNKNSNHETNNHESVNSEKQKRKADCCLTYSHMPKRQRSSAARGLFHFSFPMRMADVEKAFPTDSSRPSKTALKTGRVDYRLSELLDKPAKPGTLVSQLHKDLSFSSRDGENCASDIATNKDDCIGSVKKADVLNETGRANLRCKPLALCNNRRLVSHNKPKIRSVAGLLKEADKDATNMVGRRIKVWWPLDKQFYEGEVRSYDPVKRKHVIVYDDGDVEVLGLDRERWELTDTLNPAKSLELTGSLQDVMKKTIVKGRRTSRKGGGERLLGGRDDDTDEVPEEYNVRKSRHRHGGSGVSDEFRQERKDKKTDDVAKSSSVVFSVGYDSEASDNETLGMWRYRIKKSV